MENGDWRMENGEWRMEIADCGFAMGEEEGEGQSGEEGQGGVLGGEGQTGEHTTQEQPGAR